MTKKRVNYRAKYRAMRLALIASTNQLLDECNEGYRLNRVIKKSTREIGELKLDVARRDSAILLFKKQRDDMILKFVNDRIESEKRRVNLERRLISAESQLAQQSDFILSASSGIDARDKTIAQQSADIDKAKTLIAALSNVLMKYNAAVVESPWWIRIARVFNPQAGMVGFMSAAQLDQIGSGG